MNLNTYLTGGRKVVFLSAAFLLAAAFVSCKKSANSVGLNALNPEALLSSGAADTFSVATFSVKEDSIPTDRQSVLLLGAYHDPRMGVMNTSFYTQLRLTKSLSFNSGDVFTIDSVVLSLRTVELYGENDAQTFQVQRITESMSIDSTYYKFSTLAVDGTDLVVSSSATQSPNIKDSLYVGSIKQGPQLRLHLNPSFGAELMQAAIDGQYTDNTSFQEYFKGIRVSVQNDTPSQGTGGVVYIDPANNVTEMIIYYKLNGAAESTPLGFDLGGSTQFFTHAELNNTGYDVANVISNPSAGMVQYYAQAFETRAVAQFSSLKNIPKNSVIHNALLVLPVAYQSNALYPPSARITAIFSSNGSYKYLGTADYNDASKRYVIDLQAFVQDVVAEKINTDKIYFFPTFFSSRAERIIFNGPNTTNKDKPKLIIKYTEFK